MALRPFALFLLIGPAAGNQVSKTMTERAQHSGKELQELSWRSGPQGATSQLLYDLAVVSIVPVMAAFGAKVVGQSEMQPLFEIKEVCLGFTLALLMGWFLKRTLPYGKQVALPAAQPMKRACSADCSPHKGLTTTSRWNPLQCPARLWQFGRRCVQRRRLYLHSAVVRLEDILPSPFGSPSPLAARLSRRSAAGSHGLHDWHEALPAGFLMPVEVAACRSPPEVSAILQRLLADRWWELEVGQTTMESVPEDTCLVDDEPTPEDLPGPLEE